MSYNIDNFEVKKIENLVIPVKAFYAFPKQGRYDMFGQPKILDIVTNEVVIEGDCEVSEVTGILKDGNIYVSDISCYGESSGHFYEEGLKPLLEASTGVLKATVVWEDGDSVIKLTVTDGVFKEKDIL